MSSKRINISNVKFSGKASRDAAGTEKLTEGVPLAKLIKRRFQEVDELVMLTHPRSVGSESFRRLKTVLLNDLLPPPDSPLDDLNRLRPEKKLAVADGEKK